RRALRRREGRRDRDDEVARTRSLARGRARECGLAGAHGHACAPRRDGRAARDRGGSHAVRAPGTADRNCRCVRLPALAALDVRHRYGPAGERRVAPVKATPAPVVRQAPFGEALVALGTQRPDVVVLSADLGKYTDVAPFADAFPDRFFQIGMAEANMMGVAGGLAKVGLLPFAVTYGVFATRRAYDQIAMALATGPSRGIVTAFLPGITTPFRATHQAIDDLALMRALPGMTVLDPADATELAAAVRAAADHDGPVYMRGLRGAVTQVFDPEGYAFEIGRARVVRAGDDA